MEQKSKSLKKQTKGKCITVAEKDIHKFTCRAPFVFSIPRMYEDDYPRNDAWYTYLQKIKKQARDLKEEMEQIAQRHSYLFLQSQKLAKESLERSNKLIVRKTSEDIDNLKLN